MPSYGIKAYCALCEDTKIISRPLLLITVGLLEIQIIINTGMYTVNNDYF